MNKWQLIVLWVMVGAICLVMLTAPKVMSQFRHTGVLGEDGTYGFGTQLPSADWDYVARYSISILLIGGALILTLNFKKK